MNVMVPVGCNPPLRVAVPWIAVGVDGPATVSMCVLALSTITAAAESVQLDGPAAAYDALPL